MTIEDVARLVPDEAPKKRGSYKKNKADYSAFFNFYLSLKMYKKLSRPFVGRE